jgi:hypothetical protein
MPNQTPLPIQQTPATYAHIQRLSDEIADLKKTLRKIEDMVFLIRHRQEKWDEQGLQIGETVPHEKDDAAPHC